MIHRCVHHFNVAAGIQIALHIFFNEPGNGPVDLRLQANSYTHFFLPRLQMVKVAQISATECILYTFYTFINYIYKYLILVYFQFIRQEREREEAKIN